MRLLATLVLALALFPATASACELWVDPARGSNRAPGTSAAPLRRRAGRASLPDMNVFDVRALVLDGVTLRSSDDVFHCERCGGVKIARSRLIGSRASTHETSRPTSRATCGSEIP